MKAIYIFLTLLIAGVSFYSCDKQLDLAPEDVIVEDKVFEKFSTSESAVAGTYHMLFAAAKTDYLMAEATAPTCEYSAGAARTYDEINNGAVLPENTNLQDVYESYYSAIVQANLLLHKIPELGYYAETQMKQHMAEAKFIRAYAYHRLLGWYGDGALLDQPQNDGVVLNLEHYDGYDRDKDIHPRSTNEDVFVQIIKDLLEALVDLPEPVDQTTDETRVSRANKAMCEALLARVYMYKRDYSNAALWSAKVLARDIYALESDLYKVFPPNPNGDVISFSREHLFGFPVSSNGGNWQFGGNEIYYVYNNFWYSYTFISTFADSDERKIKLMREEKNKGVTIYVTDKYPNSNGRDNVTLMRLPEMILTRAEALARTGSVISQEMIDGLNAVHMRANPTSEVFTIDDFSSMDDLIDRILLESSKELAFEGIQRFDQLRSDRPLYNPELPDNKKVLPIPLREITISNGIVRQNEGYVSK